MYISIDGEFFIEWKELKRNEDLAEINFVDDNNQYKKIKNSEYNYLINKETPVAEENKDKKSVTNNFHGPVNIGNLGDSGIANTNIHLGNSAPAKKEIKLNSLSQAEERTVKKWKTTVLVSFIIYVLISVLLIYVYSKESMFNMSKIEWYDFKQSDSSKLFVSIWTGLGIYFILKLIYDRFFDPSKENALIDLHRKKNHN